MQNVHQKLGSEAASVIDGPSNVPPSVLLLLCNATTSSVTWSC